MHDVHGRRQGLVHRQLHGAVLARGLPPHRGVHAVHRPFELLARVCRRLLVLLRPSLLVFRLVAEAHALRPRSPRRARRRPHRRRRVSHRRGRRPRRRRPRPRRQAPAPRQGPLTLDAHVPCVDALPRHRIWLLVIITVRDVDRSVDAEQRQRPADLQGDILDDVRHRVLRQLLGQGVLAEEVEGRAHSLELVVGGLGHAAGAGLPRVQGAVARRREGRDRPPRGDGAPAKLEVAGVLRLVLAEPQPRAHAQARDELPAGAAAHGRVHEEVAYGVDGRRRSECFRELHLRQRHREHVCVVDALRAQHELGCVALQRHDHVAQPGLAVRVLHGHARHRAEHLAVDGDLQRHLRVVALAPRSGRSVRRRADAGVVGLSPSERAHEHVAAFLRELSVTLAPDDAHDHALVKAELELGLLLAHAELAVVVHAREAVVRVQHHALVDALERDHRRDRLGAGVIAVERRQGDELSPDDEAFPAVPAHLQHRGLALAHHAVRGARRGQDREPPQDGLPLAAHVARLEEGPLALVVAVG
mmetsp:Transcript_35380/g.111316  ORF Transcript_35380/g.111316 Transcript_35380/m.111316 type:complete len:531 (-) Transcript_35380:646-2238(-)